MSVTLAPVDLTGVTVGQTGVLEWGTALHPQGPPVGGTAHRAGAASHYAHIQLFNESGCGLNVYFDDTGDGHFIGAGGWVTVDIDPNEGEMTYTIVYILPNAGVSKLAAVYYWPWEIVPAVGVLGNSPVNIAGGIMFGTGVLYANIVTTVAHGLAVGSPAQPGLYRANFACTVNNSVSGNAISASVITRRNGVNQTNFFAALTSSGLLVFNGVNNIPNGEYVFEPLVVQCDSGVNILQIQYLDPTNTPNDTVSAELEKLF